MMVVLRKVDPQADLERLLRLFADNREDDRHPRDVIADGDADLWRAEDDSRIAGMLLGRVQRSDDGLLRGFVDNLLVDAGYRRQGIGRRLIEAAETYYLGRGLDGMQIATREDNEPALSLYASMGYRVVLLYTRTRRQPHERRVRMWKEFGHQDERDLGNGLPSS